MRIQKNELMGRCVMLAVLLLVLVLTAKTLPTRATMEECVLPESGSWPACATGGDTPPADVGDDCVIPESGPWPPCATAGDPAPVNVDDDCTIPPSGPWPLCARSGDTPPADVGDDCVIPESGAWPPCATGGGGDGDPSLTPVPPDPNQDWVSDWVITSIDHTNDAQLAVGDYVRFLGDLESPSTSVRLQWHIADASAVTFSYMPANYGSGGFNAEGNGSGDFIVSHDPMQGGTDAVYMVSTDTGILTAITLSLPCEYEWNPIFVENPNHLDACAVYDTHTRAFQQNFEGGMIVWLQNDDDELPNAILVTDWIGTFHHEEVDTFIRGIDPIKDVTITPPDGMYQPEYSVGKVWRDNRDIREKLGWATDFGQFYSAHQQGVLNDRYHGLDYISLIDDGFVGRHYPEPWIVQP